MSIKKGDMTLIFPQTQEFPQAFLGLLTTCIESCLSLSLKKRKPFPTARLWLPTRTLSYTCSLWMHFALLLASSYINSQITSVYFWFIKVWVSLQMRMMESSKWLNVVTFRRLLFLSVALSSRHFILLGSRDSNWRQHRTSLRILASKPDFLASTLVILLPPVWYGG